MSTPKKRPSRLRVVVRVRGGVADVVEKPRGVEVVIIDYDVEGEDESRLDRDDAGRPCCIETMASGETRHARA